MAGRIATLAIVLALGILSAPLDVQAQKGDGVRIGVLRPAPDDAVFRGFFEPFRQRLRENGFLEGRNLTIELRVRAGSEKEIVSLAGELVRLKVDAIFAIGPAGVSAAARATKSIPIVAMDLESDPKAAGFVASLGHPGGNITGLFLDFPELSGKWIQVLKETVPNLTRIAVLWDPTTGPALLNSAEMAARLIKAHSPPLEVRSPTDLGEAFRSATEHRADAVLVLSSLVFSSGRKQIAELAAKHRVPTMMPFAGFVDDGGLLAYGPHVPSMFAQAGGVMAKVLKGPDQVRSPSSAPHASSWSSV